MDNKVFDRRMVAIFNCFAKEQNGGEIVIRWDDKSELVFALKSPFYPINWNDRYEIWKRRFRWASDVHKSKVFKRTTKTRKEETSWINKQQKAGHVSMVTDYYEGVFTKESFSRRCGPCLSYTDGPPVTTCAPLSLRAVRYVRFNVYSSQSGRTYVIYNMSRVCPQGSHYL